MTNYAEKNAILLPGRIPGYKRDTIQLLPSSTTKKVHTLATHSPSHRSTHTIGMYTMSTYTHTHINIPFLYVDTQGVHIHTYMYTYTLPQHTHTCIYTPCTHTVHVYPAHTHTRYVHTHYMYIHPLHIHTHKTRIHDEFKPHTRYVHTSMHGFTILIVGNFCAVQIFIHFEG